jgi:hypothetical protein
MIKQLYMNLIFKRWFATSVFCCIGIARCIPIYKMSAIFLNNIAIEEIVAGTYK